MRDDRVLCHALVGPDGVCHGVLVVSRRARNEPFSSRDERAFATFAQHCGSLIGQLALRRQLEGTSAELEGTFRQEALRAHAQRISDGDVLRVSPAWVDHAYLGGVALLVVLLVFACLGRVHEYASGSAVIRTENRFGAVSNDAGTVASVEVAAGDCAAEGQVLVRLHDRRETSAFASIERRWEAQLRSYLLEPDSALVRQALASLRVERQDARERTEARLIRAPRAGRVGEVHTRVGAPIAPGDVAVSVVDAEARFRAVAFVPAGDAPQISRGMPLRLELDGYSHAYLALEVAAVSQEAIGAAAVARSLGPQLGDGLVARGTSVEVEAAIPADHFEIDGVRFPLREGMLAHADIRLRSEPIVLTLLPWLRSL
jgi:membrane fusion protein (multidrug efflux system)